jgi:hypothetical protein
MAGTREPGHGGEYGSEPKPPALASGHVQQLRQIVDGRPVNEIGSHVVLGVAVDISGVGHVPPRQVGMSGLEIVGPPAARLADDFETTRHSVKRPPILAKLLSRHAFDEEPGLYGV